MNSLDIEPALLSDPDRIDLLLRDAASAAGAAQPEPALEVIDAALRPLARNVRTVERGQL
jgi:hypothetical protein